YVGSVGVRHGLHGDGCRAADDHAADIDADGFPSLEGRGKITGHCRWSRSSCCFRIRPEAGLLEGYARMFMTWRTDRKSTRLNSSHVKISYAVFCLKKKNKKNYNFYKFAIS